MCDLVEDFAEIQQQLGVVIDLTRRDFDSDIAKFTQDLANKIDSVFGTVEMLCDRGR